jgi:hypothetical protein
MVSGVSVVARSFRPFPLARTCACGEGDVTDPQADQFGDPQPGLDRDQQQRVVATAVPAGGVRRGEQRFDLGGVEVVDGVSLVAFGRDREHPADRVQLLGVFERCELVERVDRRQAVVAGPWAVAAVLFEVGEERADQRCVEVIDAQIARVLAGRGRGECEQQPERVAVGRDRLPAGVELRDQTLSEIRLDVGARRLMRAPPRTARAGR